VKSAGGDFFRLFHPMKRGVGENCVEGPFKDDSLTVHGDDLQAAPS
jgi:hypothetical protein